MKTQEDFGFAFTPELMEKHNDRRARAWAPS